MKNKILTIVVVLTIILSSCSNDYDFEKGKQQLEQQGYTDIENTGYKFFCCDERGDGYSTGFSCKNKDGKIVKGCFCSGLFKGITIRFE